MAEAIKKLHRRERDVLVQEEAQARTSSGFHQSPSKDLRGVLDGGGDVLIGQMW